LVWLTIVNPVDLPRENEFIVLPLTDLGLDSGANSYVVQNKDRILPSQMVDTDFDGQDDSLGFLIDLAAGESVKVSVLASDKKTEEMKSRAHAEISVRSSSPEAAAGGVEVDGGEFLSQKVSVRDPENRAVKNEKSTYRFEGPLIENDKVGYRLYWDKRGAVDVYGKTSDILIGDGHTRKKSHHTMQSWGRDLLHNGPAIGAGGLAVGNANDRISPSGALKSKIIIGNDGPIAASYRMVYEDFEYNGNNYDLDWEIWMTAGKRYMTHKVKTVRGDDLDILAGLTNHADEEQDVTIDFCFGKSGRLDWIGTYGSQVFSDSDPNLAAKSNEKMGLGLLWNHKQAEKLVVGDLEFDVEFKNLKDVVYYSLAAYNGEPNQAIKDSDEFGTYMKNLSKLLANPVIVKLEK